MSAKYNEDDGFFIMKQDVLEPSYVSYIEGIFDYSVQCDIDDITKAQKERKAFSRVCLTKTILFPLELVVSYFVIGKDYTKQLIKQQKLMWDFLRNKTTTETFKNDLTLNTNHVKNK